MANNDQWLFEHITKMRYQGAVTKNDGLKILAGKAYYGPNDTNDRQDCTVYFGSFFSTGCFPVVVAVNEVNTNGFRRLVTVRSISGSQIDHRGFIAHVSNQENALSDQTKIVSGGTVSYIAIGW